MSSPVFDLAGHLAALCAPQIEAITTHPWIKAAADDKLEDIQIGSWATQDLLWGNWIGPAYELGFTNPTAGVAAAQAFLAGNNTAETTYLQNTSENFKNAPNADIIWPGFLGYGAWGALTAQNEDASLQAGAPHPLALTVVWVAEYAYNQAWHAVAAGNPKQPWARFGAFTDWGSPEFDAMVVNLSAGLNQSAAGSSTPLATFETVATQGFRWEAEAWTTSYECAGWDNPKAHHKFL